MAQKLLSYGQKTYTQIWACAQFFGHNLVKYEYFWMKPTLFDLYPFVLVSYILTMIYRLIHVKLSHLWQKTLKMDKIGHISVRDFASVRFTKCVITFVFFKFFSWKSSLFYYWNFWFWSPIKICKWVIIISLYGCFSQYIFQKSKRVNFNQKLIAQIYAWIVDKCNFTKHHWE